jgi:sigma-E factor negative regulatory protein RseB
MVYTSLELPETIPDEMLEPTLSGEGFSWQRQDAGPAPARRTAGTSPWRVTWLPEGFELTHEEQGRGPLGPGEALHRVYSDGLGALSVYIEAPPLPDDPFDGVSFMGAVHAFGQVVDDHQVTVVGEVPEATVRRVGGSVTRR